MELPSPKIHSTSRREDSTRFHIITVDFTISQYSENWSSIHLLEVNLTDIQKVLAPLYT